MKNLNVDPKDFLKKYQRLVLWVGGSVLVSILLIIFMVIPQFITIHRTNNLIAQNNAEIATFKSKAQALQSVNQDDYKKDLGITIAALPEGKDLPGIADLIQSLLAKNNLQLNAISFANSTAPASAGAQSYRINLDVLGDQDSLRNFIDGLKTAPQIITLSGLDISASRGGLTEDTITLTAYFDPPPSSLGSIDEAVTLKTPLDQTLLDTLSQNTQSLPVESASNATPVSQGKSNPFQ